MLGLKGGTRIEKAWKTTVLFLLFYNNAHTKLIYDEGNGYKAKK